VICYRVAKSTHAGSAAAMLNGEGAREFGGRWNPQGVAAVYAAQNLSLAALEILVHVPRVEILPQYRYLTIEIDETQLFVLSIDALEAPESEQLGLAYLGPDGHLGFSVPSAVLPLERTIVLNPDHPQWDAAISYGDPAPFPFDARLLRR